MGKKRRIPGSIFRHGMSTNEFIHPTVRLRGYGRVTGHPAVAGYSLEEENGEYYWKSRAGQKCSGPRIDSIDSMESYIIPEAELSVREAQLLGISLSTNVC
jgi:hypothetical protein